MKIVNATSEIPGMTREEVERFLESKLNLQLATNDEQDEPNIQPVWFYYDKTGEKLSITTSKLAKKTQNLRNKPIVYFSIDDENLPYKGVKGKVLLLNSSERCLLLLNNYFPVVRADLINPVRVNST
jgi:general stress protein 26